MRVRETGVVLVIAGTRPEAIKLAPVIEALRASGRLRPLLVATSQHREMLRQALRPFGLVPDIDLDIMTKGQTPSKVASQVLSSLEPVLVEHRPSFTIVQGDTTTAFAAAIGSFYAGVPVGHVEAGLRTDRLDSPFPEEFNRRSITVATTLHFAPTPLAASRLEREGVRAANLFVTGNTIVDAVRTIRRSRPPSGHVQEGHPLVVVTFHRRESFGEPARRVLTAIRQLVLERPGRVRIVYPVHPNPSIDAPAREILGGLREVELRPPMDYPEFLDLCAEARFLLSDSGGLQEEAPTLGVPVLILRETTERPEVLESGWGRLVGTDAGKILTECRRLLDDDGALRSMTGGENPFGDGEAGGRIAAILTRRIET